MIWRTGKLVTAVVGISAAAETHVVSAACAVEGDLSSKSLSGCRATTSLNFNATTVRDDPNGMKFCSNGDCYTLWKQLVALESLSCMSNYKTNDYKLWKRASGLLCFQAGGLYVPKKTESPSPSSTSSGPSAQSTKPVATKPPEESGNANDQSSSSPSLAVPRNNSSVVTTETPINANAQSSGSSPLGIITGVSGGIIVILVAIIFVIRRRKRRRESSVSKPPSELPQQGVYIATLQSSRSRQSADALLRASVLGSFVVPSSKFAFWDDEAINAVRIPYEKLTFHKLVSRGGYGEVHCGRYRDPLVAIKTLLPDRRKDMRQIESFLDEVKLMAALEHDHIVRFVGVAWDSLNELCVVSEFMQRGDLRTLLWEYESDEALYPKGFNLDKIKIALHVAHALTYMHSLQPMVLHRDLKSRNILLDTQLNAKVTDFGVSRERADATMTVGVGSSLWMAPEVMMGGRYDEKADVFSFGVVLSELDVHALPYSHAVEPGTGRKLPDTVIVQMMTSHRLTVEFSDDDWSGLAQLGRECVCVAARDRPSTAEVQHRIHQIWRGVGGVSL